LEKDFRIVRKYIIKYKEHNMDNQNEEFTIYNEQLAREAFNTYIGSCGYMLMEIRLNEMENIYYG